LPNRRPASGEVIEIDAADASDLPAAVLSPVSSGPEEVLGRSSLVADNGDRTAREPGLDSPDAVLGGGASASLQSSMTESRRD